MSSMESFGPIMIPMKTPKYFFRLIESIFQLHSHFCGQLCAPEPEQRREIDMDVFPQFNEEYIMNFRPDQAFLIYYHS